MESPIIYRRDDWDNEVVKLDPSIDRGEHRIDDELVFSDHTGYVFHDSRGIESGSTEELGILQEFIRRKCGERRLHRKLHAIWYCVPMDNQRPGLDLKLFKDICPDPNVPVIAVFTKYDQFRRNVQIHLEDFGSPDDNISDHYLNPLGDGVNFVRLEKMHRQNMRCNDLIEKTAAVLNEDIVALMLLAVQRVNLELSVKVALNRVHSGAGFKDKDTKRIVRECLIPFPYIWASRAVLCQSGTKLRLGGRQYGLVGSATKRD
ncbi:hypothetical protein BJY52DRAFT_1273154 [Lactarius psammicola]|nr:hypothetical protein BJY52DRAFT_1273154 [Lactarius psammicola]